MIRVRSLLAIALLLVAAGCTDNPVPPRQPVEGNYEAVLANGAALPAVIRSDGSGGGVRLLRADLSLAAAGNLDLILLTQRFASDGSSDSPVSETLRALYQEESSSLTLRAATPEPLPFHATAVIASDGSIRLTVLRRLPPSQGLGTYPVELIFRRR